MNETCDRCGPAVHAVYRAGRVGEIYLCGHCANRLWPALSAQGWSVRLVDEHEFAPQAAWRNRGASAHLTYYVGWLWRAVVAGPSRNLTGRERT
jgi:hypothetical protein